MPNLFSLATTRIEQIDGRANQRQDGTVADWCIVFDMPNNSVAGSVQKNSEYISPIKAVLQKYSSELGIILGSIQVSEEGCNAKFTFQEGIKVSLLLK